MIAIHPLGFILAVVFAVSMGGLMWWMFRVPPYLSAPVARARVSVEAIKRILVPTVGTVFAGREVELACRLGEDQKAEIFLAYLLEVPRTLSLGAPMPQEEVKAREALELAKTIVDLHGLPSRMETLRARVAGERIAQVASEQDIDMIIVGMRPGMGLPYEAFARTVDVLMRKAPCELLIDRVVEFKEGVA
jgi:nucleotide-binding universal stress UspA family protein